jgi:hypothetical protein
VDVKAISALNARMQRKLHAKLSDVKLNIVVLENPEEAA